VLGSLQSAFASAPLSNDGGSSGGGHSSLLDFQKQVNNLVAPNTLPTLGGSVLPTDPTQGTGAASTPNPHQQTGVGRIDDSGQGWWQDRGGITDPHNRH
jgi:hypothetical protein